MQTIDLSALIGSRICHDLISPISAIGNGVELMELSGIERTPEIDLIAQSVENANARIRFFRIAFGKRGTGGKIAKSDITGPLAALSAGGRVNFLWPSVSDSDRDDVQLVFLALLCIETALPLGGDVTVQHHGGQFEIHARAKRINTPVEYWNALRDRPVTADLPASHVQFALLPQMAKQAERQIDVVTDTEAGHIMIRL